jgi:uncharacterized membrane protein YdjX (TVP38/TMEM64 family)
MWNLFKSNKKSFFILLYFAVVPFLGESILLGYLYNNQDLLLHFGIGQWCIFFIVVSVAMSIGFCHTTFITVLSGYFMGWMAVPFLIVSYFIASAIGFYIGTFEDKGRLMADVSKIPKAQQIVTNLKKNEFQIIILARLSPIFPFAMMNVLLSYLKADLKKYFSGSLIGMLPRTLLFLWAGSEARSLVDAFKSGAKNDFLSISVLFMLILSLIGLFYYILKATKSPKA